MKLWSRKTKDSEHQPKRVKAKYWSDDDIQTLINCRSVANPPTFRNISHQLNEFYRRTPTATLDRPFTDRDCMKRCFLLLMMLKKP